MGLGLTEAGKKLRMSHTAQALNHAGRLVFHVVLLAILAAVIFVSFSFILPPTRWSVWRLPISIAASGAVVLMVALASFSTARPRIMDSLAAVLGLASAISGIAITLLIVYGIGLNFAEHKGSRDSFIYMMTDPAVLKLILIFALIPAVPGAPGLWIARTRSRQAGRVSLAAMAARFSTLAVSLSAMMGVVAVVGALVRRVMWP